MNTIADSSGNGNDGHFVDDSSTTTRPGKLGQAIELDGTGFIDLADGSELEVTDFTIATWAKFDDITAANQAIYWGAKTTSAWGGYGLFINRAFSGCDTDQICVWVSENSGSNYDYVEVGHGMSESNRWYHIVATWDNTAREATYYIDGVSMGSNTSSYDVVHDAAFDARIGSTGTYNLDGTLDDFRIYDRVLSADEIQRLYELGQ